VADITWDEALRFEPECADVSVSIVPVTQFYRQPEETFVSNIFVKTLSNFPEGYNIIEVSHTTHDTTRHDTHDTRTSFSFPA
jgi:hypothetical protein